VSDAPTLTIYSKPGCHLCDDMKQVVIRLSESIPLRLEEIDISQDPELEARYGLEIPVLMVDGRKAAKYRISDGELRRLLEARRQ
jgi:thiol-disulfide isomerase/thioredoxin